MQLLCTSSSSKYIQLHKFRVLFHVLRACASSIRALYQCNTCIHRDTAVDIPAAVDDFFQEECRWWTYSALTDRQTLSFLFCPILEYTSNKIRSYYMAYGSLVLYCNFTSYMSRKVGVVKKIVRANARFAISTPST